MNHLPHTNLMLGDTGLIDLIHFHNFQSIEYNGNGIALLYGVVYDTILCDTSVYYS